jgi:hypothetical protein
VAEVLRKDQVGLELEEQVRIHRVNALTAANEFLHLLVNGRGGCGGVHARTNERRLGTHGGRVIAFVRDADKQVFQAEGAHDFGGGGEERANAHGASYIYNAQKEGAASSAPTRNSVRVRRRAALFV